MYTQVSPLPSPPRIFPTYLKHLKSCASCTRTRSKQFLEIWNSTRTDLYPHRLVAKANELKDAGRKVSIDHRVLLRLTTAHRSSTDNRSHNVHQPGQFTFKGTPAKLKFGMLRGTLTRLSMGMIGEEEEEKKKEMS